MHAPVGVGTHQDIQFDLLEFVILGKLVKSLQYDGKH